MANTTTITSSLVLEGETLLKNQLELVTATTVAGTLYGIIFTLFCLYLHSLTRQLRVGDRKGQTKFMIGYSTVIMLCGLYYLVTNAWVMQDAYIKHSNRPGGPLSYIGSMFTDNPLTSIGLTCQVIVDALTSAIQIWRVWVIWSATRYAHLVIVPPILCFLTFTALELRTVILKIILPSVESFQRDAQTTVAETALQGATTILCTMLISVYLIVKQWQQRKLIGKAQGATGYMSVVAMLVESYALESIWLLAVGIVWNHSIVPFFQKSVTYIAIIAYFLVQYRVAGGKAYESQRGEKVISSLHWNHSGHVTTMFGGTVDVHGGPQVRTVPEASNVPEVSRMA